ncbi:hypothetical protein [Azospirillum argentinense]
MMRTYGKVYTSFWTDPKTITLSGDAQRLALYLLTGPHSNSIGCFRLPTGYLMEDLRLEPEQAVAAIAELEAVGFIVRDAKTGWTLIVNFLRHNPPENGKVGKSMLPLIEAVPRGTAVWAGLVRAIQPHGERYPDGYAISLLRTLETVSLLVSDTLELSVETVSDTVCHTVSDTLERKSGTSEPEPKPEPNHSVEAYASTGAAAPGESAVYRRGRELLGAKAGGLITKLRKKFDYDDRRVMQVLGLAGTKDVPREYVGRILNDEEDATAEAVIVDIRREYEAMGVL